MYHFVYLPLDLFLPEKDHGGYLVHDYLAVLKADL